MSNAGPKLLHRLMAEGYRTAAEPAEAVAESFAQLQYAPIIVADGAARMFLERQKPDAVSGDYWRDVRTIRPPFPVLWLEAAAPNDRRGVLMTDQAEEDGTRGVQLLLCSAADGEKPRFVFAAASCPYDEHGIAIRDGFRILKPPAAASWTPEQHRLRESAVICTSGLMLSIITLIHCKNVGLTSEAVEEKHAERLKRKVGRRDGGYRFHTLTINGKRSGGGCGDGSVDVMPLHICRGHYKEFASAKPLFGQLVGTWWWSMNIRGKVENGIADKDYRVPERDDAA